MLQYLASSPGRFFANNYNSGYGIILRNGTERKGSVTLFRGTEPLTLDTIHSGAIFEFGRGFYGNTYISVLPMLMLTPTVRLPNA